MKVGSGRNLFKVWKYFVCQASPIAPFPVCYGVFNNNVLLDVVAVAGSWTNREYPNKIFGPLVY